MVCEEEVPSEFVCPITNAVMTDPVMSKYGHCFERAAILEWIALQGKGTCPITRKPLRPANLASNKALLLKIKSWKKNQRDEDDTDDDSSVDSAHMVAKRLSGDRPEVPTTFLCPINKTIMMEPVMTREGTSFERSSILQAIEAADTAYLFVCNIAGVQSIVPSDLVPNGKLKNEIRQWMANNKIPMGGLADLTAASVVTQQAQPMSDLFIDLRHDARESTLESLIDNCLEILEN